MQSTIKLTYPEVTREMVTQPKTETYDCRLAAMRRMIAMLDAGVDFVVEHIPHDNIDAHPVRHVTDDDELQLLA